MEEIKEILKLLEKAEFKKGPHLEKWFKDLTSPDLGLIDHIIKDSLLLETYSNDMIRILYLLQVRETKSVSEQILENQKFCKFIEKFVNVQEMTESTINLMSTFIMTYSSEQFLQINPHIYKNVIVSVTWIQSDEVLAMALEIINENLRDFKSIFLNHSDATFIIQLFLRTLNRSEGFSRLQKIENFAIILENKFELCYTTDLMVLVDILISIFDNRHKVAYSSSIKVLEILYTNEEFSGLKYRNEYLIELLEEIQKENFFISDDFLNYLKQLNEI